MKKSLAFILAILISLLSLTSCSGFPSDVKSFFFNDYKEENAEYLSRANWNCDDEMFSEVYIKLYFAEIERLQDKYDLEYMNLFTRRGDIYAYDTYKFVLYDKKVSICIRLKNTYIEGTCCGDYDGQLFYFGDENGFGEYEEIKKYVDFLNDFTAYAAYDADVEQNQFERLYYEALGNGENSARYTLHHDNYIRVRYDVKLQEKSKYNPATMYSGGEERSFYHFHFQGILKGLI